MKIYYSASTRGFHHEAVHGDNMPEDAKEISPELHKQLLAAQAAGHGATIQADAKGMPVIVVVPQKMNFSQLALFQLDKTHDVTLWYLERNAMVPDEWRAYRDELREIAAGKEVDALPALPNLPHA